MCFDTSDADLIAVRFASDLDHRIIDAVSVCLDGVIGQHDDVERLIAQIEGGSGKDKLRVACEIAVALARWSQDLKRERDAARRSSTTTTKGH